MKVGKAGDRNSFPGRAGGCEDNNHNKITDTYFIIINHWSHARFCAKSFANIVSMTLTKTLGICINVNPQILSNKKGIC